jgi:regulator of cell morphogenesis and NO signaling
MSNPLLFCTLAQLVVDRPGRYRRLNELGLDFCCTGRKALSQACAEQQLDPAEVSRELMEVPDNLADATDALHFIADHIDHVHHAYVRQAMPRLRGLLLDDSVGPKSCKLRELIERLEGELMEHMLDEERTVFVFARSPGTAPDPQMSAQIHTMIQEHDDSGHELERIRHMTDDYAPAPEASAPYQALMQALRELDTDMHKHIYEENNLLFPLALSLATRMRG